MNPAYPTQGYRAENVPLQSDVGPGQMHVSNVVQHTTVVIENDPPNDHVVWSLLCFVYGNPCCLGLAALIYSFKARKRMMFQDMRGARDYASTARCLNITSTVLVSLGILIMIITIIVIYATAVQTVNTYYNSRNPYGTYYG